MTDSPFRATARELASSHFSLAPGDDTPVELTLGGLATLIEQGMTLADSAASLAVLRAASAEAFDTVYRMSDSLNGVVRLLVDMETGPHQSAEAHEAANLLELVAEKLTGTASTLEMACRDAKAGNGEGKRHE